MARLALAALCALALVPALTAKSVTYPGIGTFDSHDFFDPKHRPFTDLFLPQSPQHIDPQFKLFTRKNKDQEDHLVWNSTESIKSSHFDGTKPTKVVTHGFIDNQMFGEWMQKIKNRYLEYEDVNVIVVDWHKGNFFPYGQASVNTRVVGAMVAIQIQALVAAKGGSLDSYHVMGHSLGSHVAGYAGKFLKGQLGRITGLDPAGPFFEGLKPEARLWHTDAKFVDSIHTDARPLLPNIGFGMYETCSHVDIFPNGGRAQPGCDEERITATIFHGLAEGARRLVACNHQRAVDYFIDSLDRSLPLPKAYQCSSFEDFVAGKCIDCGPNGERCVIMGPRDPEYTRSVTNINAGVDSVDGKRFFMVTGLHEPLLSGFQYVVHLHYNKEGIEKFDKTAHIHLKFVDKSGHSEVLKFNDEHKIRELFRIGHSYTHFGTLGIDPANLDHIDFEWDREGLPDLDILHLERMHVDQVEVLGLSSAAATTKSAPTVTKYCHSGDEKSQQHVNFNKC